MPSGPEWIIVLVVVLVIFGGSQLPKLARNLGKAQKEFKDGLADGQTEPVKPDPDTAAPAYRDPHRLLTRPVERSPGARAPRRPLVGRHGDAPALQDASPLPFAAPAPHAVVDAVLQCVLQARRRDRAAVADLAGLVDPDTVAGEERRRRVEAAVARRHPRRRRVGAMARFRFCAVVSKSIAAAP